MCKKCFYGLTIILLIAVTFLPNAYATAEDPEPTIWRDDFEDEELGESWFWINESSADWNLTENPGFLRIYTATGGTAENFLYRDAPDGDFAIETHLLFEPIANYQIAGLVIFLEDGSFLQLGRAYCDAPEVCVGNGIYFDNTLGGSNFATEIGNPNDIYLRMEVHGDMIRGLYGYDGVTWFEIGTHWIPGDLSINSIGLTSAQDVSDLNIPADFDYFVLTEGFPVFPSQFIWADPYHNCLNAWGWDVGEKITIRIWDEGGTEITPDDDTHEYDDVYGASWELNDYGIDLQAGYEIQMTGNVNTLVIKTLVVSPLDIEAYDFNQNRISGVYDPSLPIDINLWGYTVFGFATDADHWAATFSEMPYGAGGEVWQTDEDGDQTGIGMWVPSPRLTVSITDDWFRAEDFPKGADVTVSIFSYEGDPEPWQAERATDENGFLFVGGWEIDMDFNAGMVVEVSHDLVTKRIVLEAITMYVVDEEFDYLAGNAPPERDVWVGAGNEFNSCGTTVRSGSDGFWEADFSLQPCDITPDMWKAAQVFDSDWDATEANPGFPRGSHDYDNGDVPYWACNVGGWVVDPDDQTREVLIRIWADDEVVYEESTAGNGFEAHLWDVISSYDTHVMLVEAYDEESEAWYPVENSPRELTCRTQDIYYFDPTSGETHQVTDLRDTNEYNPSWSPIGRFVVYDVTPLDHSSSYLSITDSYTGFTYPLYGTDGGNDAIWSSNGMSIIFDRHTAEDDALYEVPVIGGHRKLIKQDAISADLSPDGKYLVYQQPSDGSLRTMSLTGKGKDTLIVDYGEHPVWSPDGNWIAFQRDDDIWKVRINSAGRSIGEPVQVTSSPFGEGMPTWSADSQSIIYHAGLSRDYDLWKIPADGGMPEWLTGAPEFGDYDPSAAKYNDYVAYSSFSPNGQSVRTWVAAFTYDLDGLSPGDHYYYFTGGEDRSEDIGLTVNEDMIPFDCYVLFRPNGLVGRIGEDWIDIEDPVIRPDQPVRFMIGWTAEGSYQDALDYYGFLSPKAYLDDEEFILFRHEVFPFSAEIDWGQYVFSFTW